MSNFPTFRDFMDIPLLLFDIVGLFIFRFDKRRHRYSLNDRLQVTLLLVVVIWNISCMGAFLFYGKLDSTIEFTTMALYWTFALSSSVKGAWMFYMRHKIRRLFWQIVNTFPNTEEQRLQYNLDLYYVKIRKYNKFLTSFHMVTTTMFNIFPLLQSIGEFMYTPERGFPYYLPYMMAYPFDERQFWGYLIAYVLQCLGAYTCSCFFLGTDLLTLTLIHTINMYLESLKRQINDFTPCGNDNDIQELKQFLRFHQQIYA